MLEGFYQRGDFMDGARVDVTMDGTVAEAEAFLCDVGEPIVRDGNPPDGLGGWVWHPNGEDLAVDWDTSCP